MPTRSQRGTAATEFILVLPSFLVVCMFIMEVSLIWVDRHFMRLAAFEGARVLAAGKGVDPCQDEQLLNAAKRKVWLRMSNVTTPFTAYLSHLNKSARTTSTADTHGPSKIGHAFGYIVNRLPVAVISTEVFCRYNADDPQAVTLDLTYYRSPRLPFVRDILWALYVGYRSSLWLREHGLISLIGQNAGRFYFAVIAAVPRDNYPQSEMLETRASSALKFMRDRNLELKEAAAMLSAAGIEVPELARVALLNEEPTASAISNLLQRMTSPDIGLNETFAMLTQQLKAAIYATPWRFRFIPMRTSVRLVKTGYKNAGREWKDGKAMFVAPFNMDSAPHWRAWAEKMSEVNSQF